MTDIAILAVVNNPELKLARDDVHIAQAQAFSASLLPDPQLAFSADFKLHPDPGSSRGYALGPSYDFGSLLTHASISRAAAADAGKADLNLLWQEWQVIAQARLLFIKLTQGAKLQEILQQHDNFLQLRTSQSQEALRQGLISADIATVFLTASQDLKRQSNELQRQQNQARHDLNTLLGLAPTVEVRLQGSADLAPLDSASIKRLLPSLAVRRPDLMALKSGYAAEDQRYRAAIIGQFPALSIGLTRTRDTSNVSSRGFNVSLSLPIFNRNRGNIAIEQATREKLHDDYQRRLNLAYSDVDKLLAEQKINQLQIRQVTAALQQLQQQRERALAAFQARNVDALMLTNLDLALLAKQTERIALEQAMLEQRVALQSLIGGELPTHPQGKSST